MVLGASAIGTVLDFGLHITEVQEAKDAYDASVASYRQTALAAFQEVEDDLASLSYLRGGGGLSGLGGEVGGLP